MKKCLLFVLVLAVFSSASAATHTAASCSSANVQAALNLISANGDIVAIPAGSCTWTTQVSKSTSFSFTLQGQSTVTSSDSHGNPTAWHDTTLITDGQPNTGGNQAILDISLTGGSGQVVRMTGISWHGGGADSEFNGDLVFDGGTGTQTRIDHNHFINEADLAMSFYQPMSGVVDHNQFDVTSGNAWNGVRVYNTGGGGYGDEPWAANTNFGTGSYVYIENNTFNNGFVNDCEDGGTYVARYNSMNTLATSQNIGAQSHATGSQPRGRGCRAWEVYGNWIGGGGGTVQYTVGYQTSGTGVWWGNTVTNAGSDLDLTSDREGNNYSQTAPPNGWGYCGTAKNGSSSHWDGNTVAAGYPCLDQVGRGKGDQLSGYWPNVQNNTSPGNFTGVWPHQAVEPIYMWMENFSGSTSNYVVTSSVENNIHANRDYFVPVSGFNGTSGTGYGTVASRPSTCTAGAGSTPGVAYWATDQSKLYACTATNTWTLYYQPYTYPHPLVTGGVSLISTTTTLSAASTSLSAGSSDLLTATVASSSATGSVSFYDAGVLKGTGTLSGGVATFNVTGITAGTHSYTAIYGGDSTYASSTSSAVSVTASSSLVSTTTTLAAASTSLTPGSSDVLTATVSNSAATGTVTFYDAGVSIGTGSVSSGVATHTVTSITSGTHTYTASYGGDSTYASSTSSAVTVVAGTSGGKITPGVAINFGVVIR